MIADVFPVIISYFSKVLNWAFNIVINETPRITLGMFIISAMFIGLVIYFIFGTDFFPNMFGQFGNDVGRDVSNYTKVGLSKVDKSKGSSETYEPRHAKKSYVPRHGKE